MMKSGRRTSSTSGDVSLNGGVAGVGAGCRDGMMSVRGVGMA